jgi:hypothetical protein
VGLMPNSNRYILARVEAEHVSIVRVVAHKW